MKARNDTDMGGAERIFPVTQWSLIAKAREVGSPEHRDVLNELIRRYWKPVYCYLRRSGHDNERAKDLAQDFFALWLEKDLFGKADPAIGRFRTYLLSCLKNFISNSLRDKGAKKRRPPGGVLSIHELSAESRTPIEPIDRDTPEAAFHRMWTSELVLRTLAKYRRECLESDKHIHYKLFKRRVIEPILKGAAEPSCLDLARKYGLSEKEVSNRLVTARRAFQRLLRDEVRVFAKSEDEVAAEIRDLFDSLGG